MSNQTTPQTADERRAKRELARARKPWAEVIALATAFAAAEGLCFEPRNPGVPEYQIGRITGDGVRLVIYPHQQTNSHLHARIRNENSTDAPRAADLMRRIGLRVNYGGMPK